MIPLKRKHVVCQVLSRGCFMMFCGFPLFFSLSFLGFLCTFCWCLDDFFLTSGAVNLNRFSMFYVPSIGDDQAIADILKDSHMDPQPPGEGASKTVVFSYFLSG